ncbi:MAG: YgiT-type zinc finger protein [Anaerolineales bacterium]|nr:YgiT-type zinc finger protein [Anaerolineales bacterium]MCX7608225.1 YgiT-type zinc finger protein [Anaerolineales bacterium]MDW8227046.1 YgiT-type zinc finger protein [Anaerolineales bacterium]
MSEAYPTYPCHECQAGVMRLQFVTYFTWLDQELITVPNFPAWVCDVCGRREYDQRALASLQVMLNPEAGRPVQSSKRLRRSPPQKTKEIRPSSHE